VTMGFFSGGTSGGGPLPTVAQPGGFPFEPTYYRDWPRIVAFRPGLTVASASSITGTDALDNPTGLPSSFTPTTTGPHSAVVTNGDWHYSLHLGGIKPFLSSTEAQWFDPTTYSTRKRETDFLRIDQ
jgi:hypothetical protein